MSSVNTGSWPRCCKAQIVYDFGHCTDSPGSPSTETLTREIDYIVKSSNYYAIRVALLVQEQVQYAEKALLDNGFFLACISKNDSGRKIFTYLRPTVDVYHVEVDHEKVGVSLDEDEDEEETFIDEEEDYYDE